MNFTDILNQAHEETKGGGNLFPPQVPTKHKMLLFNKDTSQLNVCILPSADLQSAFWGSSLELAHNFTKEDGSTNFQIVKLPLDKSVPSRGRDLVDGWAQNQQLGGRFGQDAPRAQYYLNVVLVDTSGDTPKYVTDEYGTIRVQVLKITASTFNIIIERLQNGDMNTSNTPLSFMDVNGKGAPVQITKPRESGKPYDVTILSHKILPALPEGWQNELEDLSAQSVPTEQQENGENYLNLLKEWKEAQFGGGQPQANPYGAQAPQGTGVGAGTGVPIPQYNQAPPANAYAQQTQQAPPQQQQAPPMQQAPSAPQAPQQQQAPQVGGVDIPQAPQQQQAPPAPSNPIAGMADEGSVGSVVPELEIPQYQGVPNQAPQAPQAPQAQAPQTGGLDIPNIADIQKELNQNSQG